MFSLKMMWLMLASLITLCKLTSGSTAAEKSFEGCFAQPYRSQGRSEFIFANDNDRCVQHCRDTGFILAATNGPWCHCTQAMPKVMLALRDWRNASGPGSACSKTCPKAYVRGRGPCTGDECCGGTYQAPDGKKWKAFSMYAVSGIAVVDQIKKRVKNNINGHQLLWKIFDECVAFERIQRKTLMGTSPRYLSARTDAKCRSSCDREVLFPCVAYSYKPIMHNGQRYSGDCHLYRYLTTTMDAPDTTLYIRRCFRGRVGDVPVATFLLDSVYNNENLEGYLVTARENDPKIAVCHPESHHTETYKATATVACRELGFLFGQYLPKTNPTIPRVYTFYDIYCDRASSHLSECIFNKMSTCKHGVIKLKCQTLGFALTNKKVDLFLQNYQRMIQHNPPTQQKAIDNVIEQDNTHSNAPQSQSFMKTFTRSERADVSQETGFQQSEETTKSHETERSSETSFSTSFSLQTSVTASVSASFFVSASASTTISNSLETSASKSFGQSSTTGTSTSKERTKMFEKGWSKTYENSTSKSYSYNLDVPAFHKGILAFFEETYPLIFMWRATFKLNGFIKIRLGPMEKEWHVSRLLTQGQRIFFTMNKMVATRKKYVAKVVIKDANGNTVAEDIDAAQCTNQECTQWYGRCTSQICANMYPCLVPTIDECLDEHQCLMTPEDYIDDADYDWKEGGDHGGDDALFQSS